MNERAIDGAGAGRKAKHKVFCVIFFFVDKEMLTFNSLFDCFGFFYSNVCGPQSAALFQFNGKISKVEMIFLHFLSVLEVILSLHLL